MPEIALWHAVWGQYVNLTSFAEIIDRPELCLGIACEPRDPFPEGDVEAASRYLSAVIHVAEEGMAYVQSAQAETPRSQPDVREIVYGRIATDYTEDDQEGQCILPVRGCDSRDYTVKMINTARISGSAESDQLELWQRGRQAILEGLGEMKSRSEGELQRMTSAGETAPLPSVAPRTETTDDGESSA